MPVVGENPNKYFGVTIMPQKLNTEVTLGKSFGDSLERTISLRDRIDMSGASKWEIFENTFKGCVVRGAGVGSAVGIGAMIVPDFIIGHGAVKGDEVDDRMYFSRKGMAGHAVSAGGGVVSVIFQKGGKLLGHMYAHANEKDRFALYQNSIHEQQLVYRKLGEERGLKVYRVLVGVPVAATLALLKVPGAVGRSICTGVGGFVGGVAGLFLGAGRAAFVKPSEP